MMPAKVNAAAIVVPVTAEGNLILVLDPTKTSPFHWKFPGGNLEPKDYSEQERRPFDHDKAGDIAAIRELEEETGARVLGMHRLMQVYCHNGHRKHIRLALVDTSNLKKRGDEGEYVRIFTPECAQRIKCLLPMHRWYLACAVNYLTAK